MADSDSRGRLRAPEGPAEHVDSASVAGAQRAERGERELGLRDAENGGFEFEPAMAPYGGELELLGAQLGEELEVVEGDGERHVAHFAEGDLGLEQVATADRPREPSVRTALARYPNLRSAGPDGSTILGVCFRRMELASSSR